MRAQAVPYPGLATDLHPPLAAFLTQCPGVSIIQERVYENRLLYVSELRKMGADVITAGQTALISGPRQLYGTTVRALDVRAGRSAGAGGSGRARGVRKSTTSIISTGRTKTWPASYWGLAPRLSGDNRDCG